MTASTQTAIQSSANGSKKSAKSQSKPAAGKITSAHEEGTVKWFDSKKGYGFITRSMGEDIFVHFRSIQGNGYRSLQEGQAVKYIVTKGDKGPQAEDIHVV
ncbi:MAG: cold shock domain-containing protein [gamma proteobacterium symbiont of Taylorina sp.]|nr:cold shock domain-containing protein [gamma proteobacterium symbiont of Taylorina sp.]